MTTSKITPKYSVSPAIELPKVVAINISTYDYGSKNLFPIAMIQLSCAVTNNGNAPAYNVTLNLLAYTKDQR